jgi:hypothetical protein
MRINIFHQQNRYSISDVVLKMNFGADFSGIQNLLYVLKGRNFSR